MFTCAVSNRKLLRESLLDPESLVLENWIFEVTGPKDE